MAARGPRSGGRRQTPAGDPVDVQEPVGVGRRPDWREEIISTSGVNVLAGVWLIISPWALGYESGDASWNPLVFGAAVTILAMARTAGAFRQTGLSLVNVGIGIWLFASAFWLAESNQASWNAGIMGVVVFLLAAFSASASRDHARGPRA